MIITWAKETVPVYKTDENGDRLINEKGQYVVDHYVDIPYTEQEKMELATEINKRIFRKHRDKVFANFDIIKTNIGVGLADPLTQAERDWYFTMLDFPDYINHTTEETDWPVTPERFV